MRFHTVTIALAWAVLMLTGCDSRKAAQVELLPGLRSHMSSEQVRTSALKDADRWSVLEDTRTASNDKRPPFHILKVAVGHYSDLGEPGVLHLQFFNDRLLSVTFYPRDERKYLAELREKRGVVVEKSQKVTTDRVVSVRYASDYRGQPYVSYSDQMLEEELTSWIKKYS